MIKQNDMTTVMTDSYECSAHDTTPDLENIIISKNEPSRESKGNSESATGENNVDIHKQTSEFNSGNVTRIDDNGPQRIESRTTDSVTDSNIHVTNTTQTEKDNDSNETDIQEDSQDANLPIDRGWAWVILLASFLAHFMMLGQLKCFGIFFVQYQRRFGSTSAETSLIFTMMNATYSISALLSMTLGRNIPTRVSMLVGAVTACIGSIANGFVYDASIACVTVGVATGLANAFVFPQVCSTINMYFEKRRGFANNIMNGGVSVGTIVLSQLLTKLFEVYGFTGTHIFITGINLQLFVITCLVRPFSFYKKETLRVKNMEHRVQNEETKKLITVDAETNEHDVDTTCNDFHSNGMVGKSNNELSTDTDIKALQNTSMNGDLLRRRRYFSESDKANHVNDKNTTLNHESFLKSTRSMFTSSEFINSSIMNLTLIQELDNSPSNGNNSEDENQDSASSNTKTCTSALRNMFAKLFDKKLLSNPVFQYYLICNALLCSGCGVAVAYLPTHAIEMGVSDEMAALLVSVSSIMDIISKFVFGYISDKGWCHRSTLIAASSFILGVAAQFMYFMTSFPTLMIYAVIGGLLQGVYFALFIVVIIDILEMDNLKGALGFISLAQGITSGLSLPLAGYLRDFSGSYNYTFNFIGCILMAGGILCYFVPNVHEWHKHKQQQQQSVKQEQQV